MNFICETCNFKSDNKQNYTRHCQSKKHLTLCGDCDKQVTNVSFELQEVKHQYELRIRELETSVKYLEISLKEKDTIIKEKNEMLMSLLSKQPTITLEQSKQVEQPKPVEVKQPEPFVEEMKEIKVVKKEKKIEKVEEVEQPKPKKKIVMKDFLKEKCEDAWCFEELMCNANETITLDFLKNTYEQLKNEEAYFKPSNYFKFLSYVMKEWNLNKYTRPFHISDINRQILYVNNKGKWDDLGEKNIGLFVENNIPRQLNQMFVEKIEELQENLSQEEYQFVKKYFIMFNPYNKFNKEGHTFDNCPIHEHFSLENCFMNFFEMYHLPENDRY